MTTSLSGDHSGGPSYIPGPQLQRLTPAARRRLQDQLILAAAPASPIAEAIRARNGTPSSTDEGITDAGTTEEGAV